MATGVLTAAAVGSVLRLGRACLLSRMPVAAALAALAAAVAAPAGLIFSPPGAQRDARTKKQRQRSHTPSSYIQFSRSRDNIVWASTAAAMKPWYVIAEIPLEFFEASNGTNKKIVKIRRIQHRL